MPVSKNRRKNRKKTPLAVKKKAKSPGLPPLPDRRAMEGMLAALHGHAILGDHGDDEEGGDAARTAQAQQIMYQAWEAPTKRERIALAQRALEISDCCADAHVLLAEEASSDILEARQHYEAGVAAGERALGPEAFKEEVGYFWGILETRPYMRARAGLAECLWRLGERNAAIAHLREMLRLNPNDNQGLRHMLIPWLFTQNDLEGLEKLFADYQEDCFTESAYSKALFLFKKQDALAASEALSAALERNAHVPALLLGAKRLPKSLPAHYTMGSKEEAALYTVDNKDCWSATEGALPWLAETVESFGTAVSKRH